jgi:hypothetical protein
MFIPLLALLAADQALATLQGKDMGRLGIEAQLIMIPEGRSAAQFTDQLIAESGLTAWNGQIGTASVRNSALQVRYLNAGDGRNVAVYFMPGHGRGGRVCRIRARRGGWSPEHYRAVRWCAAAFGIAFPETPPSPVFTASAISHSRSALHRGIADAYRNRTGHDRDRARRA